MDQETEEMECEVTLLTVLGRILPRCNLKGGKDHFQLSKLQLYCLYVNHCTTCLSHTSTEGGGSGQETGTSTAHFWQLWKRQLSSRSILCMCYTDTIIFQPPRTCLLMITNVRWVVWMNTVTLGHWRTI